MLKIAMDVSTKKTVDGKAQHVKVGTVDIFVPTLDELGVAVEAQLDDKGVAIVEDGIPVYKDAKHNYVQNALFAQVKMQARNKLVTGTATLKPGVAIATDWETLTAEGGGNTGEGLAIVREVKALFAKWATTLGKSPNAQATMNMLFSNKGALALQSEENRDKIATYVGTFAETLDADQLARYMKYLDSVLEACKAETADDF